LVNTRNAGEDLALFFFQNLLANLHERFIFNLSRKDGKKEESKMATTKTIRLTANADGKIEGVHGSSSGVPGFAFSGRLDLMLIKSAWEGGVSFEDLVDGFGAEKGTNGDWSAIRDSSEEAIILMLERALNRVQFSKVTDIDVKRRETASAKLQAVIESLQFVKKALAQELRGREDHELAQQAVDEVSYALVEIQHAANGTMGSRRGR
jgi:hypothetical protein